MVREAKVVKRLELDDDDHLIWIRLWENNEAPWEWSIEIEGSDQSSPTRFPRYSHRRPLVERIARDVCAEGEENQRGG